VADLTAPIAFDQYCIAVPVTLDDLREQSGPKVSRKRFRADCNDDFYGIAIRGAPTAVSLR